MPLHATTTEINEAVEKLTAKDWMRLRTYASQLIFETRRSPYQEPHDLINEALVRALDGRRKWPLAIPFRLFVARTMESVINHDTDRMDNKPGAHTSFDLFQADGEELAFNAFAPSAEDEALAAERRRIRMEALLAADKALANEGDTLARVVLRGMLEELSQSQLARRTKAAPKDLDAAKRRVQRRLSAALAQTTALH